MEQPSNLPADPVDPFAATAPFYDLDLQEYEEDIAFYRELLTRMVGPDGAVLELGCGTGRIAIPLAEAGLSVVGVDSSPAMLAEARRRAASLPEGAGGPEGKALTLIEGDMRSLDLHRRFAAVILALGGLQHVESMDELVAVLHVVAGHLDDGGIAILDLDAPHSDDFIAGPRPLVEHWTRPWQGGQVTKLVAVDNRPAEGLRRVTFHYDVQPGEGPLRRLTHRFVLRIVTAGELELAARLAGLAITAQYGDYELGPFEDGSDRQVVMLERAG